MLVCYAQADPAADCYHTAPAVQQYDTAQIQLMAQPQSTLPGGVAPFIL